MKKKLTHIEILIYDGDVYTQASTQNVSTRVSTLSVSSTFVFLETKKGLNF